MTDAAVERQPGVHRLTWRPHGRRYALYIPPGYSGSRPAPLVLALHYGGPAFPFKGEALLLGLVLPALQDLGAVMLAPDCTADGWDNPTSEADTLALLDHVQNSYRLDKARTLIVGYSMGGKGTWYLAARHQDRFSAALPISARPQPNSAEVPWRIPFYVIHSRSDEVFPLAWTESVVDGMRSRGAEVEMVVLEHVTHHETGRFAEALRAAIPWIRRVWQ